VGVGSLILNWRFKPVRNWILGSLIIIFLVEFIFSMLFFWPRNEIMFEEGVAVHSIAELKQVAFEFQLGHWFRVAGCAAAAMMSWMGFLKMERLKKDTQGA